MEAFFYGTVIFFAFVIPAAAGIFTCRALVKIPDELFQKILHFILLGAYIRGLLSIVRLYWFGSFKGGSCFLMRRIKL